MRYCNDLLSDEHKELHAAAAHALVRRVRLERPRTGAPRACARVCIASCVWHACDMRTACVRHVYGMHRCAT